MKGNSEIAMTIQQTNEKGKNHFFPDPNFKVDP